MKKTIDKYEYEIDENNSVRIWNIECPNEENKPFFYQPNYPDGTPWESADAAENWVIEKINEWLTPPQEPTE